MSKKSIVGIILLFMAATIGLKFYLLKSANKEIKIIKTDSNIFLSNGTGANQNQNDSQSNEQSNEQNNEQNKVKSSDEIKINSEQQKIFVQQLSKLNAEIGQTHEKPELIEKKLDDFSKKLSPVEIAILKSKIFDIGLNGDDRAMAVELLSRNRTAIAFNILADFISTSDQKLSIEFETILKAQAIEGITQFSNRDEAIFMLEKLESKQSNSFLADRMRRAVVGLRFNQPLQKQDEASLKKLLLEKNKKQELRK